MWNQNDILEALQTISKRAATDKSFRELCLKDAVQAIKVATGKELPENYTVRFVENPKGVNATFVLPNFKENPSELDDDMPLPGTNKCGATCGVSEACLATCIGTAVL